MMRYIETGTGIGIGMSMMNIREVHNALMHLCTYPFAIIKWPYKERIRLIFVFGL